MNHGEIKHELNQDEVAKNTLDRLSSSHGDFPPVEVPSAGPMEHWHLKIDDKQFGPVTRVQLEYFLRPPRLCSVLQVMCSLQEGTWHVIARHETIDKVLSKFGVEPNPTAGPLEPPTNSYRGGRRLIEGFREAYRAFWSLLLKHKIECALLFAIIAFNIAFIIFTSDGLERERQILKQFESIWEVAIQFNPDDESKDDWREYADNAIDELEPLINELVSFRRPSSVQQRLLFIGREQLLVILKEATPAITDSKLADMLNQQLSQVRKTLVQE